MSSVRWPTREGNWQSQQLERMDTENRIGMKGKGSGKSHSWWWDSHNTPKNSKWLEDNLNDMDSKVKAMLKLIEEDADSFAKRAEMYYKKRPELVSLVEDFYRAYRSLAERYDQLTGHIRQIPQEIQAQFGFSGDAPPGSPVSGGSVRRRAAGFSMFASPGTPKRTKEKGRKDGSDSSSSSSSDSDSDSKNGKPKQSDEIFRIQEENEQLRKDLDKGVAHNQALEARLAELQEELKSLQHQNVQLHRNAASAHSEIAMLEAEIERLKRENHALGEEASSAVRTAEKLQNELDFSQDERRRLSIRLEESGVLIQDLEAKIKELEGRIMQLTEELLSSTASCKRLEQELAALLEERSTLLNDASTKAGRIIELEEEIAHLRASLSLSESERDKHFELHQSLEKTLADVHIEFSSVCAEKGKLSEELLFNVQHVQSLEEQLKQVQDALERSERERVKVVELLSKAESSLLDLHNEFGSMQERLNGEISVQAEENDAYRKQVEELQAALAALHGESSRGVELQDILEKRLMDLELQLKEAKEALESSETEKTEAIGLLSKVETSFLELQGEFSSMEVRLNVEAQEKKALNVQVEELHAALEALQGERSRGIELQGVLEKQLIDFEIQLKQVQEALEASEREKVEVNRLLSEVESNLSELQDEFGSMQEKLNSEILVYAQEKQVLQEQVEELQATLAALHGERSRGVELQDILEKRVMDLEQQLNQAQATLEQAEREKAEVGGLLSKAEIHLTELQAEFVSVQIKLSGEISTLSQEKQVLVEQVEELQATLAAFHSEKSRGIELQNVFEKQLIELQQELSQAKQESSCLSDELAEKISHFEGEVRNRDETVRSLQGDLLAKQEEGEALKNQLEDCSKELQTFEIEVQKLRALIIESEDLAKTLEAQIVEIQQSLELERMEANKMRSGLDDKVLIVGRLEGEVQNRDMLIANLHDEISANLEKIAKLKKELEEASETLEERGSFVLNLEMEHKRLTEDFTESQQRTAHHVTQWQLATSDKERVELELTLLQEANSKLQFELASRITQVEQLDLDLKVSEETFSVTKEENAKLTADLDCEMTRSRVAEEKCLLQEHVILDLQEVKTKLVARVEELELLISKLQEEIEDLKVKSDVACQEKEALELEIQGLRDELSKIKQMSDEQSTQLLETISYLKTEISRLEVGLASSTEQLQFFEKEQVGWNQDRAALDEGINQLTKEKLELQDTILMWSQRMEKLETEHTTLKTSSRDIESSMLLHQTEHGRVTSELREKTEKIQWLEEELKRLQLELISSQEDTRQLSIELQQVTQELKDQLTTEEGKVHLLRDDVNRLQQDLVTAQEARETVVIACQEHSKMFQVKEESLESQILKLKREIHDLDGLCKELARKLEDKTKEQEVVEVEKEELQKALLMTQQERESVLEKCDSLTSELAQEHESRVTAEAASAKFQAEIAQLLEEIARLQAELQKLKEANLSLTVKVEAAVEQERIDAMEIEQLLKALQGEHEEKGNPNIGERSWHFEAKHSTFRHLKESMVNILTDRSRIRKEAAAHAEHVKALNLEIEKSGQMLDHTRGDYHTLLGKHESSLSELQALQLRISQFEGQVLLLEEEKRKLHDQLLASVRDSDELSAELLKEKKELYEKLVVEGEHVVKLQQELKIAREEIVENRRNIDDLHEQIEKLLLDIQEISKAKEEQENRYSQEVQQHVQEKASAAHSLTEALGALSLEKAEVLRHQEEISIKDQQHLKLEEEIALLRATLSQKEQEFLGIQQHRDSLESRLEAEIRKLEEWWTLWQEEKSSLASSLSLSEKKATELLEQLGMLTQEKEEMSLELQSKVVSLDAQQVEIQRLQKLLEESELKIQDLKEHFSAITQKYDAALAELESLQLQLSSLQEENGRLGVSVTELTEIVSSTEKNSVHLKAELKTNQEIAILLQEQVASLQVENDQLKQALKSGSEKMQMLDEEISNLHQLHNKLQNEHECLASEKQRSFDEYGLILLRLEKVEKDLTFKQGENSHLEAELNNAATRIQDLEVTISKLEIEKKAFSVEIASTVLLMNDVQRRADDLQEEINQLREDLTSKDEQLQQKNEEIEELSSKSNSLKEEKRALGLEFETKIQDLSRLEATLCALQDEHVSLVDKHEVLTEEATSGANVILKLREEISQIRTEKETQEQVLIHRKSDIQRLQEDLSLVQESEKQLRKLLDIKEQEVFQLEEELERLKAARFGILEEHKQHKERLEIELKKLEIVIISLRDEKIAVTEQHALSLGRCNDLEALCKSLQKQLAEHQAERKRLESQLSLFEELRKEALDDEEMVRLMQERVASKQHEIDQVQSINEDLKEIMRKFESEMESLKGQIIILQEKNTLLNEEVLTKASLMKELDQSFTSLKEEVVVFEGGFALAVGNVGLLQVEVDKLLEKVSKLSELSMTTGETLQKMEDRICKLQVSNLNLRDEIAGLAKKEKSYVIAVRFMRAEFFCLVQRIKAMKEEKVELARLAEMAMDAERKKNGEVLSGLHQELAFLREENKRQRGIIFDRAEEKREAIRQLCATIDFMQAKNRRLEGVINSVREKIQRRIAASSARR